MGGYILNFVDVLRELNGGVREKFLSLFNWFKSVERPVLVAFSGGVDSSVVLAVASLALGRDSVIAVTATSPIHHEEDLLWAKRIAEILAVRHVIIESRELEDTNFISNPPNRCYFCKKDLAEELSKVAREFGAKTIVDGTNASDLNSYRPGLLAFAEAGVRSPLADAGITKDEVREIAKALKLPNWDRPPMSCLATRIPHGERITIEKLERIAEAEKVVKILTGARLVRVRDHGYIARIEVGKDERKRFFNENIMDKLAEELQKLGYKYVMLDLYGYRSEPR
uniref:ATP-dependent sacrificial sulfur transferase LarE n=1 Tax=Ignisphaera aggregans TaxID=334771 RepID=A0A7J2U4U4_9CREN